MPKQEREKRVRLNPTVGEEGGHSSDGLFEFIAKVAPCLLSSRDAFALSGESPS